MTKGRPVKLTEAQVQEIQRRAAGGESVRSLAREFKVSPALISAKCSTKAERLRTIARAKVTVDRVFEQLPPSEQGTVSNLMDQMKSISNGLMRVADLNGKTATLIAEKGHKKAQKLGEDPDIESLREIAAYAETGNKLTTLGVSLVNNRRETFVGSTLEDLVSASYEDVPTSVLLERVEKIKAQLSTKDLGGRNPFQTINVITGVPARDRTEDGNIKFSSTPTPLADIAAPTE